MNKMFNHKRIAIFGDIMLDKYIYGNVERISPEAPIPIVAVKEEKYVPGGAANVAANVVSLGAEAFLFGITGTGTPSEILIREANVAGINTLGVLKNENVHTIQKIRVTGQSQQIVRLDYESKNYSDGNTNEVFINVLDGIENLSAIIVSDYAKGTVNMDLMDKIREVSLKKDIHIFVDPKPVNAIIYHDVFLITPNLKEAAGLCNIELNSIEKIENCGKLLMNKYNANIIITRGADGMSVFGKDKKVKHIPTVAKQVFDVSGAGDTVIATLCLSIISGMDMVSAANMANHAACIKVGKLGTAAVTYQELEEVLKENGSQ